MFINLTENVTNTIKEIHSEELSAAAQESEIAEAIDEAAWNALLDADLDDVCDLVGFQPSKYFYRDESELDREKDQCRDNVISDIQWEVTQNENGEYIASYWW